MLSLLPEGPVRIAPRGRSFVVNPCNSWMKAYRTVIQPSLLVRRFADIYECNATKFSRPLLKPCPQDLPPVEPSMLESLRHFIAELTSPEDHELRAFADDDYRLAA